MSLDLSRTAIPRRIQENLIAYMRVFVGLPGVTSYDAESFWFVSNRIAPGNIILRTNWEADRVEERIDALFDEVGQHLDQIDWFVFPHDQPADLGKRLEARGIPGGAGGNWLWADRTTLRPSPIVPNDFYIRQVRDDQAMAEWLRVSEIGFGGEFPIFYDAYARPVYGADAFSLHFTGYLGDTPVTSGTLLDAGGCASIYDVSTPPAYRGHGFGSAITQCLMQEIRKRGYSDTWIWSSNMAKPVYQQIGYVDADFGVREHTWHKSS